MAILDFIQSINLTLMDFNFFFLYLWSRFRVEKEFNHRS